jgi:hypothetical protein
MGTKNKHHHIKKDKASDALNGAGKESFCG